MKTQAIIFDLDGTLLNTLKDLTNAVNEALCSQGLPERSIEEVRNFVGNGIVKLMERASGWERTADTFDDMMRVFRKFYGEHCEDNTVPYAGIVELLETLKNKKIKTAVVSNKADFAVRELIPVYFGEMIDVAHGENEAGGIRKKPSPDMVLQTIQELDCPSEQVIYVGDSDVDVQTAKNAGITCVGVSWGFRGREFLEKNGAEYVIDNPQEVLKFL